MDFIRYDTELMDMREMREAIGVLEESFKNLYQELDTIKKILIYNTISYNERLKKQLLDIWNINQDRTKQEIAEAFKSRIKDYYSEPCFAMHRLILGYCSIEFIYAEVLDNLKINQVWKETKDNDW